MFDGLDVIQERNSSNYITAQLVRDGNIGGILARTTADGPAFYGYDGNGNVTLLTNSAGQDVGHYRYDAFGQTLEATGPRVAENPYRFSTKELHGPSGLYDYGLRFYSPGMGRWLNRDPLSEGGGINLYGMVGNNPVNSTDEYGLHEKTQMETAQDEAEEKFAEDKARREANQSQNFGGIGAGNKRDRVNGLNFSGVGQFFGRVKSFFSRPNGINPSATRAGAINPRSNRGAYRPDLLQKSMASKSMVSQFRYGQGREIAGGKSGVPIRDVPRLIATYGGRAQDWVKISTSKFTANDGTKFEIHYYRNRAMRKSVEPKTKITSFPWAQ